MAIWHNMPFDPASAMQHATATRAAIGDIHDTLPATRIVPRHRTSRRRLHSETPP